MASRAVFQIEYGGSSPAGDTIIVNENVDVDAWGSGFKSCSCCTMIP